MSLSKGRRVEGLSSPLQKVKRGQFDKFNDHVSSSEATPIGHKCAASFRDYGESRVYGVSMSLSNEI